VLGKATSGDGSLRRPEYFSVGDIANFEANESALTAVAAIAANAEQAFLAAVRGLPTAARELLCVPVFPADMARNHRLHILKVLHERQTTIADSIILNDTVLSNDRETEEQSAADRERVAALRHTAQRDCIKGGPHIYVVTHRLESLWTFLQVPYRKNAIAPEPNGSWDTTWFTWAKATEALQGPESEAIAGTQQIVSMVRGRSAKGHVP
jgi:hypothetical protein